MTDTSDEDVVEDIQENDTQVQLLTQVIDDDVSSDMM